MPEIVFSIKLFSFSIQLQMIYYRTMERINFIFPQKMQRKKYLRLNNSQI